APPANAAPAGRPAPLPEPAAFTTAHSLAPARRPDRSRPQLRSIAARLTRACTRSSAGPSMLEPGSATRAFLTAGTRQRFDHVAGDHALGGTDRARGEPSGPGVHQHGRAGGGERLDLLGEQRRN